MPSVSGKSELTHPRVGSVLDDLIARVEAGEISAEEAAREAPIHKGDSIGVEIYLSGNVGAVVRFLEANGASGISAVEDYIEAYVPVLLLAETSRQPGVLRVRPILPPRETQGGTAIPGNGPAVHGSTAWNEAGYTGAGVKVGIIDGGFRGFADLMGTEVPASVKARCYPSLNQHSDDLKDCAGGSHGTMVAEAVMDVAPDVSLYVSVPRSHKQLRDTVDWMISEGVSVINFSMFREFDGPGDGTSPFSISPLRTVDRAVAAGIVWVNAAGNSGEYSWFQKGPFSYSTISVDGEDVKVINFEGSNFRNGLQLSGILQLRWDDSWGGASRDLDLLLTPRGGRNITAQSVDPQSGEDGHNPLELVVAEGTYDVMIALFSGGEPGWIQLVASRGGDSLEFNTSGSGSILNPAESASAGMLAVGAAHWQSVDVIRPYSSRGATPDGRTKPDLVGADCGASSLDGSFCGTSQASPHVAGLAALVRQRFPAYTPAQVVAYLKENAEQRISSPDPNNTWGHGFLTLPPPATPVTAPVVPGAPTALTASAVGSTRIDLSWAAPSNDGGSAITGYRIEVSLDGSRWSDLVTNTGSAATTYSHTGLAGGSARHYRVSAINVAGTGPASGVANAATGVATAPDLVVDTPTVSDSNPAAGARITLNATARNQGSGRSDSTTLRYYQSTDSTITTGDTEVGTDSVLRLDASGSGSESISLTAPSTAGTYYYGACVDSVTGESDTANNCSSAVAVAVGAAPTPDLVVDTPTVSDSNPAAGTRITVNATVRNLGSGRSDSTTLRYYESTDSTITTSDIELETDYVSILDPSESSSESTNLITLSSPGTAYLGVCVDSVTGESNTANNCSAAVAVTVGAPAAADLAVDTPTVSNSSPAAGARINLSATVRNLGSGRSDSTTLRYYQSADSTITTGDTQVGTDTVRPLGASRSGNRSAFVTAPSASGTYYYGACVDAVTGESNTANNCSSAVAVTVGAASVPDLVVESIEVDNSTPFGGTTFTITARIRNRGDVSPPTTRRYYQSDDATISTSDTEIGTDRVSGLTSGGTSERALSLTAPSSPGTYYYGVCVDAVPNESNVGNNCSSAVTVSVDVTASVPGSPTGLTATASGQTQIDLSWTAPSNDGGSAITGYRIEVSTDGSSWSNLVLNTNSTNTTFSHTGLSGGSTRYYRASAINSAGAGPASDTISATTASVTTSGPDLIVTKVNVPTVNPIVGEDFWISIHVKNQGGAPSNSLTVRFYHSNDTTISSSDTQIGDRTQLFGLRPSQEVIGDNIKKRVTAPSSAGTYYYGACIGEAAYETDTTNNCSTATALKVVPASQSDLVIHDFRVQWWTPEYYELKATVRNRGAGLSGRTVIQFYLSTDATISTTDTRLSGQYMRRLAATETSIERLGVPVPSTGDTYYYGACVHAVPGETDTSNNCSSAVASVPGPPTGLTATANGQSQIDLSWTAPSTNSWAYFSSYKIEVSTDNSSWSDLVANTYSTATSYSHTGLTAGSARYYRVSAINIAFTGAASNVANATTDSPAQAATVPGAPTGLTAAANGETRIDLSWTRPSSDGGAAITGYKIEVSTDNSSWSTLAADTGSTAVSYSHTGLTAGSTRYYRVSAINSAGTGTASSAANATTDSPTSPLPPATSTPQAPDAKAVTGTLTDCSSESESGVIYDVTITGSLTASKAVTNVRVEGYADGDVVGFDLIGDMAAGHSVTFTITGITTDAPENCRIEFTWIERN